MNRIEGIYVLDETGKSLLQYTSNGARPNAAQTSPITLFNQAITKYKSTKEVGDLILIASSSHECNPLLAIEFLNRLSDVLKTYFGQNAGNKATTVDNSIHVIAQLLGEMTDAGYTVTTEPNQLQDIILQPSLINKLLSSTGLAQKERPAGTLSTIPWRRSNVRHGTNEFFVDVHERISAIIDPDGKFVKADVHGTVECTSQLSGVPDLTLVLRPASALQCLSCHPCVRLTRIQNSPGHFSFIPPEGRFLLSSYQTRLDTSSSAPLPLRVSTANTDEFGVFEVRVQSVHKKADNIKITIPVPRPGATVTVRATGGDAVFTPYSAIQDPACCGVVQWTLRKVDFKEETLKGTISPGSSSYLETQQVEENRQEALRLEHLVLRYSHVGSLATGAQVDSLKIATALDAKPYRGVRYTTECANAVYRF